jgi:hypothetical protein
VEWRTLSNISRMVEANAISVDPKGEEKQNASGIEHPHLTPG